MNTSLRKFDGRLAERKVAAKRYLVVSATGAVLGGNNDRTAAERSAANFGGGAHVVQK